MRAHVLVLGGMLFLAPLARAQEEDETWSSRIELGREALGKGDARAAHVSFLVARRLARHDSDDRRELAAELWLARSELDLGDHDGARWKLAQARAVARRILPVADPVHAAIDLEVARCVRLEDRGSASVKWARRAFERLRECAGRDHPACLQARHELALGLATDGDFEGALDELDGTIAAMTATGESRELASALRDRGSIETTLGRDDDARRSFERALASFVALEGEESVGAASVLLERGKLACREGELVVAAASLGRAERIFLARCGERDLRTAAALAALGELRRVEGRTSDARALLGRALEAIESARGRSSPEARAVRVALARVEHARGDDARAAALLASAQGASDTDQVLARVEVARGLRDRHDERRAERVEADALSARVTRRSLLLAALGSLALARGDTRAAERSLALALEQAREDVDSRHPALADLLDDLARARRANGVGDVKALVERAASVRDEQRRRLELALGDDHEDLLPVLEKLASERRELGEETVARGLERRAAEIRRGKK